MSYKRTLIHDGTVELKVPAVTRDIEDPVTGNVTTVEVSPAKSLGRKKLAKGSLFGGLAVGKPVVVTDERVARAAIAKGYVGANDKEKQGVELDLKRWAKQDEEAAKSAADAAKAVEEPATPEVTEGTPEDEGEEPASDEGVPLGAPTGTKE